MTNSMLTETPPKKKAANIPTDKLHTFEGHPFQVIDNEEMDNLAESIKAQGIISPLIVRPMEGKTDEYEVISGHRRLYAAIKAGLTEVPALIYPLDRNQAIIAVVDSNLHREKLLPSEKAFAYKMKLEAMKRQGKRTDLTLSQLATKSDSAAEIGKATSESRDQVFRYIRLTNLIPELLQKVDEGAIAFSPAVELSYLTEKQQEILLEEAKLQGAKEMHQAVENAVAESQEAIQKILKEAEEACSQIREQAAQRKEEAVLAVIGKVVGEYGSC